MTEEDEKAQSNPLIVMTHRNTGDKYCRAAGRKGVAEESEGVALAHVEGGP